jgi:hypothetical protein
MNTRPTPETDEESYDDPTPGYPVVRADFARKLERERDEALHQMEKYAAEAKLAIAAHESAFCERDEARELEAMYQKVVAACLRCDPIPACQREDDQLEPPWEVIDRIRCELNDARAESTRWQSIAEGRGRTDDEIENDTQAELAAWELLKEAEKELAAITAQRDRLAEALEQIIEEDGVPMSMRASSSKSLAKQALQSLTPNSQDQARR